MAHRIAERFDFALPRETRVFLCERVAAGAPILEVSTDEGDWQFLCGGDHGDEVTDDGPVVACLECTVAGDATLNEVASMRCDSSATRAHVGGPWTIVDGVLAFIRDAIDRFGWAVQLVPAEPGDAQPAFAYTVGLFERFGHAELLILGLENKTMHAVLNQCAELVAAGRVLRDGTAIDGVFEGYSLRVRAVAERASYRAYVGCALDHYAGRAFPLVQVLWPDRDGTFPDAPDAPPSLRAIQPLVP